MIVRSAIITVAGDPAAGLSDYQFTVEHIDLDTYLFDNDHEQAVLADLREALAKLAVAITGEEPASVVLDCLSVNDHQVRGCRDCGPRRDAHDEHMVWLSAPRKRHRKRSA